MEKQIGVDKEKIDMLSKHIRDAWNHYFFDYQVCQNYIRFTNEERSNYFGDLLNYFDDITTHLSIFSKKNDYHSALYDVVAVLQFMYVQQDLIDEMLTIFKLPQSSSSNKNKIRLLRNELVGHPISRDKKNDLVSSVFITAETKGDRLSYLRYHRDRNFEFDVKSYSWSDIFDWHNEYLEQSLSSVVNTIGTKLTAFKKILEKLIRVVHQIPFEKVITWVGQVYERFHKDYSRLYNKENILFCYAKRDSHIRYQHAVNCYLRDLTESLEETIKSIMEVINADLNPPNKELVSKIEIYESIFDSFTENPQPVRQETKRSIHYEFGKLYEQHPVFGVDYFLQTYENDGEIIEELQNMKFKSGIDPEYYCSYKYLKQLFQNRGLL